mmetsp:Transcript_66817/g.150926  ORF Transcript_66817/g.150926 Transcript_66817/m.150926 type:complete len:367 (-) Transcript_66817:6-1106(-)
MSYTSGIPAAKPSPAAPPRLRCPSNPLRCAVRRWSEVPGCPPPAHTQIKNRAMVTIAMRLNPIPGGDSFLFCLFVSVFFFLCLFVCLFGTPLKDGVPPRRFIVLALAVEVLVLPLPPKGRVPHQGHRPGAAPGEHLAVLPEGVDPALHHVGAGSEELGLVRHEIRHTYRADEGGHEGVKVGEGPPARPPATAPLLDPKALRHSAHSREAARVVQQHQVDCALETLERREHRCPRFLVTKVPRVDLGGDEELRARDPGVVEGLGQRGLVVPLLGSGRVEGSEPSGQRVSDHRLVALAARQTCRPERDARHLDPIGEGLVGLRYAGHVVTMAKKGGREDERCQRRARSSASMDELRAGPSQSHPALKL